MMSTVRTERKITTRDLMRLLEKADQTFEVQVDGRLVVAAELAESPRGPVFMIR
jgi:hypothetical protein